MDADALLSLAHLVRTERVAALGTLRSGAPLVSMVPYAVADDCTTFWLHLSRLAFHTQDILKDPRVSLMIAETDTRTKNPQMLARVSIQSEAIVLPKFSTEYEPAKTLYLAKLPDTEMSFGLGDFDFYRIEPRTARYVAGFGRTFNLTANDFREAAKAARAP
jgi:heme iron utilization protein